MSREVTPIDYATLAERAKSFAQWERRHGGNLEDIEFLDAIESLLREMAEAKPFAWTARDTNPSFPEPGPWGFFRKSEKPRISWPSHDLFALYLHPAPQPQPTEADEDAAWCDAAAADSFRMADAMVAQEAAR